MSLIHRHNNSNFGCCNFNDNHFRDIERRFEEIQREMESHFPRSFLNRDLWVRPRFNETLSHHGPSHNHNFDFDSHFAEFEREMEERRREMRRHFDELEQRFSQVVGKHGFDIEKLGPRDDIFPKVVDRDGQKNVALDIHLPKNVDPSKINVSIKDGDLIIQADDKTEKPNESSQLHYYRRTTLPHGTDLDRLKADLVNGNLLSVSAPLNQAIQNQQKNIPISYK